MRLSSDSKIAMSSNEGVCPVHLRRWFKLNELNFCDRLNYYGTYFPQRSKVTVVSGQS